MLGLLVLAIVVNSGDPSAAPELLTKADIAADLPPQLRVLVEQTFSDDPTERRNAVTGLSTRFDPRVIPALLRSLQDADPAVRKTAITHFSSYPDARSVVPLLEAMKDADASIRERATTALGKQKDARVTATLIEALQNAQEDIEVRCAAASGLNHDCLALRPLMTVLKEDAEPVRLRVQAVHSLTELGDPEAAALLMEVAKTGWDLELRFWAAIGAVKLTHGAIDDPRMLVPIEERYAQALDPEDSLEHYSQTSRQSLTDVKLHGTNPEVRAAAEKAMMPTRVKPPPREEEDSGPAISGIQLFRFALLFVAVTYLAYLRRRSAKRLSRP